MEITLSSPLYNNKVVISGENCEVDSQSVRNVDNVSVVMQSGGAKGPPGKDGLGADPVFILSTEQRLTDLETNVVTGENIVSHKPIALINNVAYLYDASNPEHLHAFIGFSTESAISGEMLIVQKSGVIDLQGWNLTPSKTYIAGVSGQFQIQNTTNVVFSRVIGFAQDSNSLLIINESPILN